MDAHAATFAVFQSTPPAEAEGDSGRTRWPNSASAWFQSTPPAEAEGDEISPSSSFARLDRFNPLPPPRRRETRPRLELPLLAPRVSIHSPRRGGGRRDLRMLAALRGRFNPLPPPRRRETDGPSRDGSDRGVSIHSPRRGGGRLGWPSATLSR